MAFLKVVFLFQMTYLGVYLLCIVYFYILILASNDYKVVPRHEISNNVACATSKASDQPAHTRSLIRAFASSLNIL